MRGSLGVCVLLGLSASAAWSCRAPTQVTLVVTTDVGCAELRGTTVTVGRLGEIEAKVATTSSTLCDASGNLGALVIVPSGDPSEEVAVKVVAGVGRDAESCVPPYGSGCIVARRALHFLPHASLRLTVPLRAACNGISCGETETCVDAKCVGAVVGDPSACAGPNGCGEEALPPASSADAGAPDAPSDASLDASGPANPGTDSGSPPGFVSLSLLSAGTAHVCTVLATGAERCWGQNSEGEVGDGTNAPRPAPAAVSSLGGIAVQTAAGGFHACALLPAGNVRCWGYNFDSELSDGTTTNRNAPVDVLGLGVGAVATEVVASNTHSCVLLSTGGVTCWGANNNGQLGDGTTAVHTKPYIVAIGGVAIHVVAGWVHSCAIMQGGGVKCWGDDTNGPLGNGSSVGAALAPVDVVALGGTAVQLGLGFRNSCALLSTGNVRCWGLNNSGQLGDGTNTDHYAPADVPLGAPVIQIAGNNAHFCALLQSGGVKCWGLNTNGELGDGTTTQRSSPVDVVSLGGTAVQIALGVSHTCALLSTGAIRCWGQNVQGQLGNGTVSAQSLTPVTVLGIP